MKNVHPHEELLLLIAIIAITIDVVLLICILEPGAHFGERDEEPDARTERVVMPLGLECRSRQIGRDDVQVQVSFIHSFIIIIIFLFGLVPARACPRRKKEIEGRSFCEKKKGGYVKLGDLLHRGHGVKSDPDGPREAVSRAHLAFDLAPQTRRLVRQNAQRRFRSRSRFLLLLLIGIGVR